MPELAREIGVSEATIYTWNSKYSGMDGSEGRRAGNSAKRTHG